LIHPEDKDNWIAKTLQLTAPEDLFYGGFCSQCQCFHKIDSKIAYPYALDLRQRLLDEENLDFNFTLEEERSDFNTSLLFVDYGKMFGVLVCEDSYGNEVVLKGFSYNYSEHWTLKGWVPPLFDPIEYEKISQKGNERIYPLTDLIKDLPLNTFKRNALVKKRREVSQEIMQDYFDLYRVTTPQGDVKNLRDVFYLKKQIPMGTGDCCAPKLLAEAYRQKLKPISIAEFYLGNPGKDGKRQSGQFYSSCEGKCHPILGALTCGLKNAENLNSNEVSNYYSE